MAGESDCELKLRRFAKLLGTQGNNLQHELAKFDTSRNKKMDTVSFKRALKAMALSVTDDEISVLFETGKLEENSGFLDIPTFCKKVTTAFKAKPLPSFMLTTQSAGA